MGEKVVQWHITSSAPGQPIGEVVDMVLDAIIGARMTGKPEEVIESYRTRLRILLKKEADV